MTEYLFAVKERTRARSRDRGHGRSPECLHLQRDDLLLREGVQARRSQGSGHLI